MESAWGSWEVNTLGRNRRVMGLNAKSTPFSGSAFGNADEVSCRIRPRKEHYGRGIFRNWRMRGDLLRRLRSCRTC